MPELKLRTIKFGRPDEYHFVSFTSGEHETNEIEDRHDIDIEVIVPSSTQMGEIEEIALIKAHRSIKQLAASL